MNDKAHGDINEGSHWQDLAHKHWLDEANKKRKVKADIVKKEIWDRLEEVHFAYSSLLALESLQLLESYLWPGYTDDSVNHHVVLIALLVTVKSQQHLPTWDIFMGDAARFSSMFRRVLSMSIDTSLPVSIRSHSLCFLIVAFQSLDNGLVRKECAPLVSISIWHNLESESARERKFEGNSQLRKAWRASAKRYEAAEEAGKAKLRFERSWLYSLVMGFVGLLYEARRADIHYCERFLEFLADLESQMPTRRYVNTLLNDLNVLSLIKLSPMFNGPDSGLFRDLYVLLRQYIQFSINDHTGKQYCQEEARKLHCKDLACMQRLALKSYKDKLTLLALSNHGSIDRRDELESHLRQLTNVELKVFCSDLGYRTNYPQIPGFVPNQELYLEILLTAFERRKTFQSAISDMSVLPTEASLYEESLLRNEKYDGSRPLAIPKLNLQYLSIGDFLWRAFILHRCEQFFEIRTYLEDTVKKLQPTINDTDGSVNFKGFSKMALPVNKAAILEAAPPKVGQHMPEYIRAEITLNVQRLADHVRRDWESLRADDNIFLLIADPAHDNSSLTNGHTSLTRQQEAGLSAIRVAAVSQILDENGCVVRDPPAGQFNGHGPRPRLRRLIVNLDRAAFERDMERKDKGHSDIYEQVNVVVRRHRRENNFRKVLETVKSLAVSDVPIPQWLRDVFLGFGDPASATYTHLPNQIPKLNLQDTLTDWNHLVQSFPETEILPADGLNPGFGPPYVIENEVIAAAPSKPSRKRRRDDAELSVAATNASNPVRISTYEEPSMGPYPSDRPKTNSVRFTPTQVKAIVSGTQPGLTVIVGPPGTGKTDVAAQIISNIYHDFPMERTLLIAHSNQALNQLFQKITNLDIDGRHLLRLGQGEGDLETEQNYGKYGRVESFLENRAFFLTEVDRLAANFGAPGAHGGSCETAGYFRSVYVQPAWQRFWDTAGSASSTNEIVSAFPYHHYFQSAPQPLFPEDASKKLITEIAKGCERHIDKIFTELEDIRPFEILRSNKDKTNYLMLRKARIIAMTSTHAAMRQQEIADMGFHYDNIVMEEAAQVTEVENFIPMVLQKSQKDIESLHRIVLCGDHLQNSPIIQNMAFSQFANLDQSLFLRLVRLGVPTVNLDAQGRARPTLAELYKWRYKRLENLPNVLSEPQFLRANAGFRYDYQFIDVPDFKEKGEQQPSPHFIQNLGEAEYSVAMYQYMRLLGYPASKVSIITTYAGQRALIRDILSHRCANNRLFGMPRIVTTVDKYQGEQNDYIILSLVRTTRPGYLRDLRRLTVALSRARLGLYILGRRSVFEGSAEFAHAFELPFQRPANLMLTTGEMHPTLRSLGDDTNATEMFGVEHLGKYVYDMTQAKVKMMKEGKGTLPPQEPAVMLDVDGDDDDVPEGQEMEAESMDVEEAEDAEMEFT